MKVCSECQSEIDDEDTDTDSLCIIDADTEHYYCSFGCASEAAERLWIAEQESNDD